MWRCSACTCDENPPEADICQVCDAERAVSHLNRPVGAPDPLLDTGMGGPPDPLDPAARDLEAGGGHGHVGDLQLPAPAPSGQAGPWSCPTCTFDNTPNDGVCPQCGT